MVTQLRVVLDRVVDDVAPDTATAALELARALERTAPRGCEIAALTTGEAADAVRTALPGVQVTEIAKTRGKLAAAWQYGLAGRAARGLVHAPSLCAPLVRHDRVNDLDQTVVTVWDLLAWDAADALPRPTVRFARAMLKRADRYADAVVVPTHSIADRLESLGGFAGRVRVIPGAAPTGFAVPSDAVARCRDLDIADDVVVLAGVHGDDAALAAGFSAVAAQDHDAQVVVFGVAAERIPVVLDLAAAAGLAESRVRVPVALDAGDRAAILDVACGLLATSGMAVFQWRVVEALALGVPIIAVDAPVNREVIVDGGLLVDPADLGDALRQLRTAPETARRLAVGSADRGRAFTWRDHAERVWALHAEL